MPFKKISSTILKAIIKPKTFDFFSGQNLYKNNELFCLEKYLAFSFHGFNPSNAQIFVNENKIIVATVKIYKNSRSNYIGMYDI